MSITIDDFQDLLRLLEQHPEWRAELRRQVLTDDLLELPALMRQLAEQIAALTARVDALAVAQARTEQRLGELAQAQARTEQRLGELIGRVDQLTTDVATLKGDALERRYRVRAGSYFAPIARRLQVVDQSALADRLETAVEERQLTPDDRAAVLAADLVLSGQRREDRADVYILIEVSVSIDPYDVQRAAERAALLERLGQPVVPAVAGNSINAPALALARESGVWQVLDGHVIPPIEH